MVELIIRQMIYLPKSYQMRGELGVYDRWVKSYDQNDWGQKNMGVQMEPFPRSYWATKNMHKTLYYG